ncbi:MAG: diguanylate cyclase [Magnetococcales bacterium]|nr:diguanylate cyclase [Magnetococcales bacterium]
MGELANSAASSLLPRILIIDDDPSAIQLLQAILKGHGRIYFATAGEDGLGRAQAQPPDLILLDADMPGMSGFDVCAALKSDASLAGIPVIFVTSHTNIENETRALSLGATDFISKPFSPPVVQARVRNHLLLKQHIDLLQRRAATDGLTGIANRRTFDETLDVEWRRAARRQEVLSLLLLDVDYFKRFNDIYGHPAGDECLRAVAGVLAATAKRPGDLAARYGGEEFAVLLPNTDKAAAMVIAEGLCAHIRHLGIPHAQSEVAAYVTISVGTASMVVPCTDQPERPIRCPECVAYTQCMDGPAALVRAADQGLYLAKTSGRNRVACGL